MHHFSNQHSQKNSIKLKKEQDHDLISNNHYQPNSSILHQGHSYELRKIPPNSQQNQSTSKQIVFLKQAENFSFPKRQAIQTMTFRDEKESREREFHEFFFSLFALLTFLVNTWSAWKFENLKSILSLDFSCLCRCNLNISPPLSLSFSTSSSSSSSLSKKSRNSENHFH